MKNLFFALAFLFVGSVGFAGSSIDKNIEIDDYTLRAFLSDDHNIVDYFSEQKQLCTYYEQRTYTINGTTYIETFSYIGWAFDDADCGFQVMMAQLEMADFTGN